MKAILTRAFQDARATIGILQFSDLRHDPFYILENSILIIPAGTYQVAPYTSPTHPNVYQLKDVPGRTYILIHPGNFASDTKGCLILGISAGRLGDQLAVLDSQVGMVKFRNAIGAQEFELQIRDIAA